MEPSTTPTSKGLSPATREKLEKMGVKVVAWNPNELEAVLEGHRTLGELAHFSKQKQWEVATTGLKLLKDGLTEKAKEVFSGLEALDPYDAYFQVCLGTIAMEEEDFEAAENRFSRALFINPASAPALAYRGELRLRLGRRKEGMADLAQALTHENIKGNADVIARARALMDAANKADAAKKGEAAKPAAAKPAAAPAKAAAAPAKPAAPAAKPAAKAAPAPAAAAKKPAPKK